MGAHIAVAVGDALAKIGLVASPDETMAKSTAAALEYVALDGAELK